jgi:rSAM/selenodomain-associated transferase 2
VLVVDGGSHDATSRLAQQAGASVLTAPPGRGRQQNAGAAQATGDVLLFLHADTWLVPGAAAQIAAAVSDPRVQCGAFRQRIDHPRSIYRVLEWGNDWRARWRGAPYGDQGLWLRRALFERLGGFPETPFLGGLLLVRAAWRVAWPVLLPGPLYVSPRRWERYGVVRQTLRNWGILAAFACGAQPEQLAARYRRHDQS